MIGIKDLENFMKQDSTLNFAEESLESFILPDVLKDTPYLLDTFPFEPEYIDYRQNYDHTTYKTPGGFNYDAFMKSQPMQINIVNACFNEIGNLSNLSNMGKSSYGKNLGSLDIMLLKFMGYHQTKWPILLKTTKFVGPVLLVNWQVKEAASKSFFNLTLKQTSLRPLKHYSFNGTESDKIKVSPKVVDGLSKGR